MQPKKKVVKTGKGKNSGLFLIGAVGIGAIAAFVSAKKGSNQEPQMPLVTPSASGAGTRSKTTVTKAVSPAPTASTNTLTPATVEQHGFTDVMLRAELYEGEGGSVSQFLNSGEKLIMTVPDKTYIGRYLGKWGNMLKFEMKLTDGKIFKYWVHKDDAKLMSAAQRNTYMKTGGGKFMDQTRLLALRKHFYAV